MRLVTTIWFWIQRILTQFPQQMSFAASVIETSELAQMEYYGDHSTKQRGTKILTLEFLIRMGARLKKVETV